MRSSRVFVAILIGLIAARGRTRVPDPSELAEFEEENNTIDWGISELNVSHLDDSSIDTSANNNVSTDPTSSSGEWHALPDPEVVPNATMPAFTEYRPVLRLVDHPPMPITDELPLLMSMGINPFYEEVIYALDPSPVHDAAPMDDPGWNLGIEKVDLPTSIHESAPYRENNHQQVTTTSSKTTGSPNNSENQGTLPPAPRRLEAPGPASVSRRIDLLAPTRPDRAADQVGPPEMLRDQDMLRVTSETPATKAAERSKSTKSTTTTRDGSRSLGINPFIDILRLLPLMSTTRSATTAAPTTSKPSAVPAEDVTGGVEVTTFQVTTTKKSQTTATGRQPSTSDAQEHNVATPTMTVSSAPSTTTSSGNVTTRGQRYVTVRRMCGYPSICDQAECRKLDAGKDPLEKCEIAGAKAGLLFVVIVLAMTIVVGNLLLPLVVWKNRDLRTPHNLIKVSLAFADIITGLVLLFSVVPNVVWTMESTERHLAERDELTKNSPQAIIAGSMLTLSAQASLFHLTYLSAERFVAIKWPMWHRFKGPTSAGAKSLAWQIAGIWIASVLAACLPAAFVDTFTFRYLPVLFVYLLTASRTDASGMVYFVVTMVLPFTITVVLTGVTGVVAWRKMKSTAHMRRYSSRRRQGAPEPETTGYNGVSMRRAQAEKEAARKELKPELSVFITTTIMIIGFCLTILPFIVVLNLFHSGYFNCRNYAVPYAAAFYATVSNSLVNFVVYTARDQKFRAAVIQAFKRGEVRRWSTERTQHTYASSSVVITDGSTAVSTTVHGETATGKERWERALVGR